MLQNSPLIHNKVAVTGQHQQMLSSVLKLFNIRPDYNLQVMAENQDLSTLTTKILTGLATLFEQYKPHLVLVHGDTTTLAASISAYYHQIPIAHIEAGLRTGDINSPWPEEANRKITSVLASIHFAPTEQSQVNLLREGVPPHKIFVTGNTVIDALYDAVNIIETQPLISAALRQAFSFIKPDRKMILMTGHRRENFGKGLEQICHALVHLAKLFPEVDIIYPVHLNPNVQKPVRGILDGISNIHLIDPQDYLPFVFLMQSAYIILTDSGGIQEEAPSLGKPVLLLRSTTERPEAIAAGTVRLVGTATEAIVSNVVQLLTDKQAYERMSGLKNPYGDGNASARIVQEICKLLVDTNLTLLKQDVAIPCAHEFSFF